MTNKAIDDYHAPEGVIQVIPTEIQFIYCKPFGNEFIGLILTDPKLGPIAVLLTPEGAQHVVASLTSELDRYATNTTQGTEANSDPQAMRAMRRTHRPQPLPPAPTTRPQGQRRRPRLRLDLDQTVQTRTQTAAIVHRLRHHRGSTDRPHPRSVEAQGRRQAATPDRRRRGLADPATVPAEPHAAPQRPGPMPRGRPSRPTGQAAGGVTHGGRKC